MNKFEVGQEIETEVVQISNDTVFIDIGLKSEGFVDKSEFVDENGNLTIKEGDKIKVYFASAKRDEMYFTTRLSADKAAKAGLELLENAYKAGVPVEGKVEKEIKGGFEVKIGTARAFCPYSQMGYKNREEPAAYIGKTGTFLITEYKNDGKNIIVSNRRILENQANDAIQKLSEKLTVGTVVKGTVKSLQSYGAFVDVNGFQVLLPISQGSHARVRKVEDVLSVGQEIEAKIIKAEWNGDRSKVSVSMKSLEKDPWDEVAEKFPIGTKLEGTIARIAAFGLFVNIAPGIDGLVHISALQDVNDKTNLSKKYKVGDKFEVIVEKIDAEEKRISLTTAGSNDEQDNSANAYFSSHANDDDGETYNPFAALLKK